MESLPQFDGDVRKLFAIKILTPLSEFPFALTPWTMNLQSIGHGWCVLTGTRQLHDGVPDYATRACMILWASDIAAAVLVSRCKGNSILADWKTTNLPPIGSFIPKSSGWTYGEILAAGRATLMESAVYGSNGEFEFRQLRLKNSQLYFQSRTRRSSELPVAISLS